LASACLCSLGIATALGGLSGCRTSSKDVQRWAHTSQGPRKLVAVLTHGKYPLELRVEAAMSLATMKLRGGRRVGILGSDEHPGLVSALAELAPAERARLVAGIIPRLEAGMLGSALPKKLGQVAPDDTYGYKDAAFALLTHDGGSLVVQEEHRERLKKALTAWALADFAPRMDEPSQTFGVEQVFRELKADGVRQLPDLMAPGQARLDRMAELVADLGDAETKLRASNKLVALAEHTASAAWRNEKAPSVRQANQISKLTPTDKQFEAQLEQYQEEELLRVFAWMKRVGGEPVTRFLLAYAETKQNSPKRRAGALAALEGNLGRNRPEDAQPLLDLAKSDETPDEVRDVALRRVGEMPRALVIDQLYSLFGTQNWKVRWVAAELILKMSEPKHVPEFLGRLSAVDALAMTEPLRYGAMIGAMKGPPEPRTIVASLLPPGNPVQSRLVALGYFYEYGTKEDIPEVLPYASDKAKIPICKPDVKDCDWECTLGEQVKQPATLGEFVEYCIKPAIGQRSQPAKPAPGKPQ
jgi:hypothetical protein